MVEIVNIKEVIEGKYIIPDFQRDYAWTKKNLELMLNDIYTACCAKKERYLLGPIVVAKDEDSGETASKGKKRVVDGQQRLTSLKIILQALGEDKDFLDFENRKHVKDLFVDIEKFDGNIEEKGKQTCEKIYQMYKVVQDYFSKLSKETEAKENLCNYLLNNVCFVEKTLKTKNIQHAFEVLNTVGEQLKPEDIAKAKIIADMSKLGVEKESELLNFAWLRCYDNENALQKDVKEKASEIFNENNLSTLCVKLKGFLSNDSEYTKTKLSDVVNCVEREKIYSRTMEGKITEFQSGTYSVCLSPYELIDVALKSSIGLSIAKIVNTDSVILNESMALEVIKSLLLYRIAFDKYVVRREKGKWNWSLGEELDNQKFIKIESMLAVSGVDASKNMVDIVKKAMEVAIKDGKPIDVDETIKKLEQYAINEVKKIKDEELDKGTGTNHFVFHWLDYLLYLDPPEVIKDKAKEFIFIETTSVEHFMPQSPFGGLSEEWKPELNNFGNLALITPSSNSTQNNSSPKEKVEKANGKTPESLKYELMLSIAEERDWTVLESIKHGEEMKEKLKASMSL